MASEASGPLLSEGKFSVSEESITNIHSFCRSLRLYYFFPLKWFEGEVLDRKKKNACCMAVVCVHTNRNRLCSKSILQSGGSLCMWVTQ